MKHSLSVVRSSACKKTTEKLSKVGPSPSKVWNRRPPGYEAEVLNTTSICLIA